MSLQLGAFHLALALAGAVAGRRSRLLRVASGAWALLVLLVLDAASSLWAMAGPLRFLQFPWRLLAATATLQLVAALGLSRWTASFSPRAEAALLGGLALVALGWHAEQFSVSGATRDPTAILRDYHAHVKRETFANFAFRDEFLPRAAARRPARPRNFDEPALRLEGEGSLRVLPGASAHHLRAQLAVRAPGAVVIEQLYLPGWEVALDGRALEPELLARSLTPEGFARVELPRAATYRLDAFYRGPPGGGVRTAGLVAALAAFAPLLRRPREARPGSGTSASSPPAPAHSTT
jgi:hypothetical protein